MEVRILGPDEQSGKELLARARQAFEEIGVEAEFGKETDPDEYLLYIMEVPGLVVDERVLHSGEPLPEVEEIKELLRLNFNL